MSRRLVVSGLVLLIALACVASAGAAQRSTARDATTTFFGHPIPAVGTELTDVALFRDATGRPKAIAKSIRINPPWIGIKRYTWEVQSP